MTTASADVSADANPGEEHLRKLTFNRLRAAVIASWLLAGTTLDQCTTQAGNTQAVIETRYKGVIEELAALSAFATRVCATSV